MNSHPISLPIFNTIINQRPLTHIYHINYNYHITSSNPLLLWIPPLQIPKQRLPQQLLPTHNHHSQHIPHHQHKHTHLLVIHIPHLKYSQTNPRNHHHQTRIQKNNHKRTTQYPISINSKTPRHLQIKCPKSKQIHQIHI